MAAWKLSDTEWDALDDLRFSTKEATVFRNATIILMSAAGCPKPAIANDLGCCIATVDIVRKAYRERGLEGMVPRKPSGRPSRATAEYRAAMRKTILTPPQELGYGFSVWSVARLGAHLEKETGIRFSDDQLRRIMHQEKFSYQRPKHTMKGKRDEVAYERAARQLRVLKKKRSAKTLTKR